MLREVALPDDAELPAPLPAPALGRPAAARRRSRWRSPAGRACIVLDEPTTGLDVTTQAHVLDDGARPLRHARRRRAVRQPRSRGGRRRSPTASRVMYAGRIVEHGPTRELFDARRAPVHAAADRGDPRDRADAAPLEGIPGRAPSPGPAAARAASSRRAASCGSSSARPSCRRAPDRRRGARGALLSAPRRCSPPPRPAAGTPLPELGDDARPRRCSSRDLHAAYGMLTVLHDITLEVAPRECVALVGESGSGKTTLARCVAGLHRRSSGDVLLGGVASRAAACARRTREQRRAIQYVFQSPYASLNPRTHDRPDRRPAARPLRVGTLARHRAEGRARRSSASRSAPATRPLPGRALRRRAPARGDRARARREPAGARSATRSRPRSTSRCRPRSSQLLRELQEEMGLTMLFVTHNLALVRTIAQRVAVMSAGRIVEHGPTDQVLEAPTRTSTRSACSPTRRASRPCVPEQALFGDRRLRRPRLRAGARRVLRAPSCEPRRAPGSPRSPTDARSSTSGAAPPMSAPAPLARGHPRAVVLRHEGCRRDRAARAGRAGHPRSRAARRLHLARVRRRAGRSRSPSPRQWRTWRGFRGSRFASRSRTPGTRSRWQRWWPPSARCWSRER